MNDTACIAPNQYALYRAIHALNDTMRDMDASSKDTPGSRLRAARKAAGYSSTEAVADQIGLTASAIRHHENGRNDFDIRSAKRYAELYKVSWKWILFGEENSPEAEIAEAMEGLKIIDPRRRAYILQMIRTEAELEQSEAADKPQSPTERKHA